MGVADEDLMDVLTGDGVEGESGWGFDWVEDREIESGGGVGSKGGEGWGSRGGDGVCEAGGVDVGTRDDWMMGGGFGSGWKNRGGVGGKGRGEAKNMDGDEHPSSSFSISFSSFTSAGGSTPYLRTIFHQLSIIDYMIMTTNG